MTTKDAYIQHLDEARGGLEALLPRVDIHKQIYPGWTLKQLLDHIAGWDDAVIASLRAHMDGLTPGTPAARGINYYNAETVSTRESLDYEHSLHEWHASRKLLKETIRSLAEEKLTQPLTLP
ncbi:MAG: maleylpyruvate isomerase N-terminal domain-containing protein [Chloroflexota bacterium]